MSFPPGWDSHGQWEAETPGGPRIEVLGKVTAGTNDLAIVTNRSRVWIDSPTMMPPDRLLFAKGLHPGAFRLASPDAAVLHGGRYQLTAVNLATLTFTPPSDPIATQRASSAELDVLSVLAGDPVSAEELRARDRESQGPKLNNVADMSTDQLAEAVYAKLGLDTGREHRLAEVLQANEKLAGQSAQLDTSGSSGVTNVASMLRGTDPGPPGGNDSLPL